MQGRGFNLGFLKKGLLKDLKGPLKEVFLFFGGGFGAFFVGCWGPFLFEVGKARKWT